MSMVLLRNGYLSAPILRAGVETPPQDERTFIVAKIKKCFLARSDSAPLILRSDVIASRRIGAGKKSFDFLEFFKKFNLSLAAKLVLFLQIFCFSLNASDAKTCQVHVFVHGTYGSFFTLLSYPYVKSDNLKGTSYVAIQRLMRETQLVRYRRFTSAPGLFEVSPGSKLRENEPARYVVGSFSAIQREVKPNDTNSHRYFMFGWCGLLSQQERRRESIRLYNELVGLVASIRAEGKEPVLNIYGHSHGANVVLNLGLVDGCAFVPEQLPAQTEVDVIENMNKLLAGAAANDLVDLLDKDAFEGAKQWYVKPITKLDFVNRIILFGVPVQNETAPLVLSPLFKNVLQVYSDNDGVASSDGISSKKTSVAHFDPALVDGHPSIKMIRWMNNRTPLDACPQCVDQKLAKKSRLGPLKNLTKERMKRLKNGGGNPDSHHPLDPTHGDFWSIGNKREGAFFEQVPLLVYMPLLSKLLPSAGVAQRLDFCLLDRDDRAEGVLFVNDGKHQPELCGHTSVSLKPVQWARTGIAKILNVSKKLEFNFTIKTPFSKKK
jgi:hypothetical protein